MSAREVLAELDRLGVSIFYRRFAPGPRGTQQLGVGPLPAYPELLRALDERTPELLRLASFEASRHTPGTYLRRPRRAS